MSLCPTILAIWMGDFNAVIDTGLDRLASVPPNNPTYSHTRFGKLLNKLALVDTWRHSHPQDKVFSCFSVTHNTMS